MASNSTIGDITRKRDTLSMLGMGKQSPDVLFQMASCYLAYHPDQPDERLKEAWPVADEWEFAPSETFRENLLYGAALLVLTIEAQDRLNKAERREADASADKAEAKFATVLKGDEIRVMHKDTVVYHDRVAEDGFLTLKQGIRVKAAGISYGELQGVILEQLGLTENE